MRLSKTKKVIKPCNQAILQWQHQKPKKSRMKIRILRPGFSNFNIRGIFRSTGRDAPACQHFLCTTNYPCSPSVLLFPATHYFWLNLFEILVCWNMNEPNARERFQIILEWSLKHFWMKFSSLLKNLGFSKQQRS